jgi:Cd2+/Zn2+-exporting ATPase
MATAHTSQAAVLTRVQAVCVTCAQGGRRFVRRCRAFLLDPGTLFTLGSLLLVIAAIIQSPSGLVVAGHASTPLYLASALAGSVYIWWSAIQGIRARDFTADSPVSLATPAAISIGQYSAAAVVAALLLVEGMLEQFVSARAGNALEALVKLLPDRVLVRRNSQDVSVPLEAVRSGDLVLIRSGDRIPVDGEIIAGTALANQAAITGESLPVEKQAGDSVFVGTLTEVGALEVRTTTVGAETTLGQIRRMVAEAQEQKAPIARILNRYAKFYTPCAIVLGVGVWWWSGDLLRAITILIVFCPCVMVLATPTALVASIGNAALRGSLVKKGATVAALSKVDTIAFDKTGTLTAGQPQLTSLLPLGDLSEETLLCLAAVAEGGSASIPLAVPSCRRRPRVASRCAIQTRSRCCRAWACAPGPLRGSWSWAGRACLPSRTCPWTRTWSGRPPTSRRGGAPSSWWCGIARWWACSCSKTRCAPRRRTCSPA